MTTDRPATTGPSTAQMRRVHGLLRDHGITGDKTVLEYVNADLAEHGEDPVTSRRDLTGAQADRIIADLETAEVARTASAAGLARLRETFPDEAIGHLPRLTCKACRESRRKRCDEHQWVSRCEVCNGGHSSATMHITYVGHADVTARLLEVDPAWTWEPMGVDPGGMPLLDRSGGLWINLTVLGVTRPGYGDSENGKGVKEAIGDALRNAAMRFGVALDLWAKGDREWSRAEKSGAETAHPDQRPPAQDTPPEYRGPNTATLLERIDVDAQRAGVDYATATAKWRAARDGMSVDDLEHLDPWVVAPLAQAIRERADQVVAAQEAEAQEKARAEAEATQGPSMDPGPDAGADPWATPSPGASGEQPPA